FVAKKYADMEKEIDKLKKQFATAPLPDDAKKEMAANIESLPWYAKYGEAEAAFKAGTYDKVHKVVAPFVAQFKSGATKELKDPTLVRGLMGLELRAYVMENNADKARETLDVLQKAA